MKEAMLELEALAKNEGVEEEHKLPDAVVLKEALCVRDRVPLVQWEAVEETVVQ